MTITTERLQELRDRIAALVADYFPGREHVYVDVSMHWASDEELAAVAALPEAEMATVEHSAAEEYERVMTPSFRVGEVQIVAYGVHRPRVHPVQRAAYQAVVHGLVHLAGGVAE